MTYLCVPIFVIKFDQTRRDIAQALEAGANVVELRIDRLEDPSVLTAIVLEKLMPLIVTCRPTWEGGFSNLDDDQRIALLTQQPTTPDRWIDLEMKTLQKQSVTPPGRWIISFHDFKGRPDRLYNIIEEMNDKFQASVNKIVWTARTVRDNLEAFELLKTRSRPTIALCMGEAGLISRVLAKKFGAFLTFASLDSESETAPGQISIAEMKNLYRWDAIGQATKVYGVVANPVRHSMSPAIHNAAFDATGFDGIYLPMLVEPSYESFKAFMESFLAMEELDLGGLSITIPHKENALRYLREKGAEIEELAERIGAVNTIAVDRTEGGPVRLRGSNTDYAAILDSITAALQIDRPGLAALRVAVIGAGGTGRTAVAALAHYGATVLVCNRTLERATGLAAEFNGQTGSVTALELPQLLESTCDVWINTTSVGMHPKVDANPLGDILPRMSEKTVVFDTIYNPLQTRLLSQANAAGARTIGGIEMFVRQAAAQFQLWTGQPAPREVMRKIVLDRLTPRHQS